MEGQTKARLEDLARLIRYHILSCTTKAGSGHPTSSLSAADLMAGAASGFAINSGRIAGENVTGFLSGK